AADDCYAGIHVLASRTHTGVLPFALLLQSARTTTVRIWAIDSPFDRKDALKARRYRWSDGKDGRPKAWYIDVPERDAGAECAWLDETVYAWREPARQAERITARERYSVRA
ncbi:MAG TPA: hypothetical protein VFS05_12340, partial [Gemmatimonadaceae bacterium]|nr:hypothetical protein [Gemmatimonadaceae bacterium]